MQDEFSDSRIGDFAIHEMIERRVGMTLYRATQQSLKRFAVVKIIELKKVPLPKDMLEDDFVGFTRNVVALEHMHLQPIYDYGIVEEDYLYIACRHMAGNLMQLLQTGPLPFEQTLEIAIQIAQAMAFIHAHGFIHGSLSPRNVYVDEVSSAYVDDLELSKIVQSAHSLDDLKQLIDEPFYLSVEQLELKPLDFRTEMYNFGAVLYHMLTGAAPFSQGNHSFEAVLSMKKRNDVLPPRRLNPAVPDALDKAILRMLRANPDERFPDFKTLESALSQILQALKPGQGSLLSSVRSYISRLRRPR
jgi:serine/threonine protein kinase